MAYEVDWENDISKNNSSLRLYEFAGIPLKNDIESWITSIMEPLEVPFDHFSFTKGNHKLSHNHQNISHKINKKKFKRKIKIIKKSKRNNRRK